MCSEGLLGASRSLYSLCHCHYEYTYNACWRKADWTRHTAITRRSREACEAIRFCTWHEINHRGPCIRRGMAWPHIQMSLPCEDNSIKTLRAALMQVTNTADPLLTTTWSWCRREDVSPNTWGMTPTLPGLASEPEQQCLRADAVQLPRTLLGGQTCGGETPLSAEASRSC